MKKRGEITAFYIETMVMIVVMIGILLVLTQILGLSKRESVRAKRLTEAVTIAQSAAESLAVCRDFGELPEILGLADPVRLEENGSLVCRGRILWNRNNDVEKPQDGEVRQTVEYLLEIFRTEADGMAENRISVYSPEGGEPVYTLLCRNRTGGKEAA